MSGLRVFLLCMMGFAVLCVAGFLLLDQLDTEVPPPPRPRPRLQAAAAMVPAPAPATAPITPAPVRAPALPTDVSVREPDGPLPELSTSVTHAEPEPREEDPDAPEGTLTEAPREWVMATTQELLRLFINCTEFEGEAVEGPISVNVSLLYEPNILDGPAEREASASIDDPYLAACLSDSLWDAEFPDLGAPGDFQHRMTIRLDQ